MTTFSVAMCTYNGARYLNAQLESIATQTRPADELVICDDCSSDDTVDVIKRFASSVSIPIRLEVNTRNLGSTKNFEKAISLSNGELIALADQDDVWLPQKLQKLEEEFVRRSQVGLVFSDADLVDEDLRPLGQRLWNSIGFDEESRTKLKSHRRLDVLFSGWTVTGATMAFRSKYRALVLPIPADVPVIHDGWIAAVVACVAEVAFVDEPLIRYRQHQQQQIGAPEIRDAPQLNRPNSLRDAIGRINSYDRSILIGERLRSRLAEHSKDFNYTDALRSLDERIHHFRTRETLPKAKVKRVPLVLRELFSKRYHLYSHGLHSAVKDLLT